ncbi:MAG: asparaginase domain-containing protein [Pyrinomonadaceae bacterium]
MAPTLGFHVGGTLNPEVGIYVKRSEDKEFLNALAEPQAWINVYGCRTMGKSSLYSQYRRRLGEQGVRVITVDVAAQVGHLPQTGRDWVRVLGEAIASSLLVDSRLLTQGVISLPADAATGTALEKLFVEGLMKQVEQPILLILDEYDYIGRLAYCDDILFALRHIQALQVRSDSLKRLAVCFVGLEPLTRLGTPGAANSSPIAIPIELLDFETTPDTKTVLMQGFPPDQRPDEAVLSRVLELSGGQPLVTMELLRGVQRVHCRTPSAVDSMTKEMVADSGQGKDLQLFESIEGALKEKGGEAFAPLRAYESLLLGSNQAHTAPGMDLLLLIGLVRRKKGELEVKGELFRRRFDVAWAKRTRSNIASGMKQYRGGVKSSGKRICVINTGGTLGMVERDGVVVPPEDEAEFKGYFASLDSIAEVVEFINLFPPRDSINVFPDQWATIAEYIYTRRNEGFDGFVVAHGTDTMAYSASAVAFALGPQLRFPVVFTGAQTTPDVAYGDAHVNLYRACEVAKKRIPEVVISFGNFVYRAVRAQKKDDRRFDGFESPTYPPLAEITGEFSVRSELLRTVPKKVKDIRLRAEFETSILIVPQFPGLEPGFFDHLLLDNQGGQPCLGVIVQTLGAGNVASEEPYSFIPFVERAYQAGIPVIVTSQYPPDPGSHTKYTPAEAPIKAGAIHAGNMTQAAAVAKFRWVLANVRHMRNWHNMQPDKKRTLVSKLMVEKSVIGEF